MLSSNDQVVSDLNRSVVCEKLFNASASVRADKKVSRLNNGNSSTSKYQKGKENNQHKVESGELTKCAIKNDNKQRHHNDQCHCQCCRMINVRMLHDHHQHQQQQRTQGARVKSAIERKHRTPKETAPSNATQNLKQRNQVRSNRTISSSKHSNANNCSFKLKDSLNNVGLHVWTLCNPIVCHITLTLLTTLIYYNSLDAELVYDDSRAIVGNGDVRQWSAAWWRTLWRNDYWGAPLARAGSHGSYRPLTTLTFALNHLAHGLDPFGYHLVNLMLQLVLVNYFVRLFSKMFKQMLDIAQWSSFECINSGEQSNPSEQASSLETNSEKDNNKEKMRYERTLVVAALLFAAHPVHVESVASIVGRAELLACLCTFGALDCVSRYAAVLVVRNAEHSHAGKGWFATSLACCTLGCACKETALMSFLLVIVYTAIVTAVAYQQSRQQQQKLSKQLKHREHKARERRVRVVKIMLRQVIIWSTVTLIATLLIRAAISMQWPHLSGHLGPDMTVKIWWPQFRFSTADNPLLKLDTILPTSLVDRWLTRLHVPAFAFSLVVWPKQLSYDWPLEAIQLTSMSWRQFANLLIYYTILSALIANIFWHWHCHLLLCDNRRARKANSKSQRSTAVAHTPDTLSLATSIKLMSRRQRKSSLLPPYEQMKKLETSVIGSSEQSLSSLAITPTPTMFKGPHDFYPGPSSIHSIESDKENNCNNDERPSSRSSLDSALGTSNSSSSSVSTSSTIDHVSVNNLALTHYRDIYRCPNEATATAQLGLITLALLFALLTYLPASNLIVHVGFVVAERTLYMPSVGVTILMGVAYETSIHYCHQKLFEDSNKSVRDMFYYIILVPIVLMLVMSSIERTKVWHDPISLYSSNVALNPAKSLANIGHVLASNNQLDEAEQHYKNALNIWPNQADVHLNLGLLLHKQGRIAEAIEAYNIALRYRPRLALARLNLGLAHEQSAPPGTADTRRLALEMYLITVNDTVTGAPELSKDPETQALAQLQAAIRALRLIDAKWSSNSNLLTLHYLDVVKTVAQFEHRLRSTTLQWSSKPELIDLHLQLMLLLIDHSPQVFISGLQGYLERSISDDDSSALEASDDLLDLLTRPHLFPRFTTKADQRSKDNDVEAKFALRHRLIEKLRQQGGRISSPDSRLMYAHGKLLQLWLDHYNHEAVVGASVTRHTVAQLALETIHTFNRNNQQYTNNKDTMKRKIHNYHLLAFAADAHNQAQDFNTSERLYDDALAAMKDLSQFEGSRARANIISTLLAQAHLNYGAILHRRAKYREARAQYEATLKLDPEHEMARTNLQRLPVK